MAARSSSSSDYVSSSTDRKLVALDSSNDGVDGPCEVMKAGIKQRSREAERSSFMGQHNDPQKDKGKVIISITDDFDEISTGGKVVTTKNFEAENSHMAVMFGNLQNKTVAEPEGGEMVAVRAASIECGCCYWDYQLEETIQCPNGHRFCFECVRRQVEEIIYGVFKANATLSCMNIGGCEESIPFSEIQRALPNDVIERYEARQAQKAIVEAKIEGLVYCPFCNIPYEADKCVQVLDCPNLNCLKASCIQCKKLSHVPLDCEEVEEKSETDLRREVEERMTKAVIRECNICQAKLIKTDGCNRVVCRCGNTMCYACKQTLIWYDEVSHFCVNCRPYTARPGKRCKKCNRCSLTEIEVEENEALAAKAEALNELGNKEPKLLDLQIGPPFERLRPQLQQSTQQGHHMQRFPPRGVVPPPLHAPQFLRNMAMPPSVRPPLGFFGIGDQLPNTAVPPLLASPHFLGFEDVEQLANLFLVPPPQFFRHDDQPTNMVLHLQTQQDYRGRHLQAQQDYRRQLANMQMHSQAQQGYGRHLQAQQRTTALPQWLPAPPHFFRFDDGHRLQNMAVPPSLRPPVGFFGFDGQVPYTAVPPQLPPLHFSGFGNGDQFPNLVFLVPPPQFFRHNGQRTNMELHIQAQQDYGRHLQPQQSTRLPP